MRRKRTTSTTAGNTGELPMLDGIRRRAGISTSSAVRLGIGDDCALLQAKASEEIAITTDLSIAGCHFRLDWHAPESVGHRALARGLSDLAAMGARPIAAFLSLGLPRELTERKGHHPSWADRFLDGLLALASAFKTPLAGGDLAESPLAVADIVLVGTVPRGKALLRSEAQPGDRIYVTGALGGSAAGLDHLCRLNPKRPPRRHNVTKAADPLTPHLWPQPRIPQGLWLQRRAAASAAIDISDGLSSDLEHICLESRVSAEIEEPALPIYPGATLAQALHGGEDYELLFTAPPGARVPRRIDGVSVTHIGRIVKPRAGRPRMVSLTQRGPQPLVRQGWQHFS